MNKELPDNPQDCIGLKIKLKPDAPKHSINNFDIINYIFTIKDEDRDFSLILDKRIRVYPEDQYPDGKINILFTLLGYKKIKEKFELSE